VGTWLPDARRPSDGQWTGLYRADGKNEASGLTVLRPASEPTPAASAKPANRPAPPRAVHLPGGRQGVLLFHGLSSTPLELQYLARGLHRLGYTVRVAVIEGYTHGLSTARPTEHTDWVDAALAEFDHMRAQCDTLAVGGLCIGALLALAVAARRPDRVSHVLSLSTTLHYDGWAAPWTRWLLPLARVLPWAGRIAAKEREPFGLKDERLRAWVSAQMRETGGSNAGAAVLRVKDLLQAQDLMRVVRAGLPRVAAPTLIVHARDDDAASPRSAYEVADTVAAERVRCVILEDSYHMISIDKEKARVLAEMKAFLQHGAPPEDAEGSTAAEEAAETRSKDYVRS
jgi:carboxylesterase